MRNALSKQPNPKNLEHKIHSARKTNGAYLLKLSSSLNRRPKLKDRVLSFAVKQLPGDISVALALAESNRDVFMAGALCGLGHGYTFPILSGLVVTRVGEVDRGSALALFTGIADLGAVLGSPLFGWVAVEWR